MKLTSLLAQYLYTNHRIDLPGIGTFLLDPSAISSAETTKQGTTIIKGISFQNNPSIKESPELIAFISSHSGKMKALANADLESLLQEAQQFLNIGKPFVFEGIGTLAKKQTGGFEFSPLSVSAEKLKEYQEKDTGPMTLEESSAKYESFLSAPKVNVGWRKPVVALLIVAGIALAVWAGYTISRKTATNDTTDVPETEQLPAQPQSIVAQPEAPKGKDYKYILQVSKKQTALKRFNQLKSNFWDVKLETNDSVLYKLYMLLPALNSDTTRILDSLTVMTGKKVYIEHQN